VDRFPGDVSFLRVRVSAHEMAGRPDSAVALLRGLLELQPDDVAASLNAAKIIIEHAVYDTAGARGDSLVLAQRRAALGAELARARPFLAPGLASPDTALQLNTAVLVLTAGSRLAQSQAYEQAYPWLDTLLMLVEPGARADTAGPRHQILVNGSFWYGIASVVSAAGPYRQMAQSRSCAQARAFNDRLRRTRAALERGRRVHEQTVTQMLSALGQYEGAMGSVKQAFKCTNF
jgi:hypothetical protein